MSTETVTMCKCASAPLYSPGHMTPASSEWEQSWDAMPWCWQSASLVSFPVQVTSSSWMGPTPCPTVLATAPSNRNKCPVNWTYLKLMLMIARHYLLKEVRAGCRQLQHLQHPMNHHKLCPTGCWNKSQLSPQLSFVHHEVWYHRLDKELKRER